VLAGALKDNRRALIAGERTFGKGLIQTVVELSDGSAVAVTVSRHAFGRNLRSSARRLLQIVNDHIRTCEWGVCREPIAAVLICSAAGA